MRNTTLSSSPRRHRRLSLSLLAALSASCLALSGCGSPQKGTAPQQDGAASQAPATDAAPDAGAPAAGASATESSQDAPQAAQGPSVHGYKYGEMPPIPLFTLPDLTTLDTDPGAFTPDITASVTSVPGITVSPARCDEAGVIANGSSNTILGGDGSVVHTGDNTSVVNSGDGSGTYTDGTVSIVNSGDGSGTYSNGTVSIVFGGDGSGTYTDENLSVVVEGDGSGTYQDSRTGESTVISPGGSGTYNVGQVSIINGGDGSGSYTSPDLTIINHGDGTATVNGEEVRAEPLAKIGTVGSFPTLDAVNPVDACGTVISMDSSVLFDFDSYELRPESQQVLKDLVKILNETGAPAATVAGHTDSVADDAYNQTLSENRAQAVVDALQTNGAATSLTAVGYGETQPVAPNENPDGSDNPAGRQLNRRVEIVVPTF